MFPVMVISHSDLMHNIEVVARFCADSGVSLAPHGKTTMSPELSHLQLEAGAWAITASTGSQARIYPGLRHSTGSSSPTRWWTLRRSPGWPTSWTRIPDVELFCA